MYKKNKIGIRDLKTNSSDFTPAKIEEFAQKSKFEDNKERWEIILANANYN